MTLRNHGDRRKIKQIMVKVKMLMEKLTLRDDLRGATGWISLGKVLIILRGCLKSHLLTSGRILFNITLGSFSLGSGTGDSRSTSELFTLLSATGATLACTGEESETGTINITG